MPTIRSSASPTPRWQIGTTAHGFLAETFDIRMTNTTGIPTANAASGTMTMQLIGLRAGDVITNISVASGGTNGTALTFAKLGLFDKSGNFLAATASASATFNTGNNTIRTVALTSPYTIPADDGYYVTFLQYGSGATGCQLRALSAATINGNPSGSFPRPSALVTNQTDISGNVTPAAETNSYWFGVS